MARCDSVHINFREMCFWRCAGRKWLWPGVGFCIVIMHKILPGVTCAAGETYWFHQRRKGKSYMFCQQTWWPCSWEMLVSKRYPVVMTNIPMENGHRNSVFFPINMVIVHSYVKLPKGNCTNETQFEGKQFQSNQLETIRASASIAHHREHQTMHGVSPHTKPWGFPRNEYSDIKQSKIICHIRFMRFYEYISYNIMKGTTVVKLAN